MPSRLCCREYVIPISYCWRSSSRSVLHEHVHSILFECACLTKLRLWCSCTTDMTQETAPNWNGSIATLRHYGRSSINHTGNIHTLNLPSSQNTCFCTLRIIIICGTTSLLKAYFSILIETNCSKLDFWTNSHSNLFFGLPINFNQTWKYICQLLFWLICALTAYSSNCRKTHLGKIDSTHLRILQILIKALITLSSCLFHWNSGFAR